MAVERERPERLDRVDDVQDPAVTRLWIAVACAVLALTFVIVSLVMEGGIGR